MQVYYYDEETKEFLYEEKAHIDPLETLAKGKNIYLLPSNSTFEKPLEKEEGKAVVFDGNTWRLVDDNRGKFTITEGYMQEITALDPVERILTDEEVEKINKGELIVDGSYLREKNVEELQTEVRAVRNSYLEKYVDPKQLVLVWDSLSIDERNTYSDYRKYLLDYTDSDDWWLSNPMTFDEWLLVGVDEYLTENIIDDTVMMEGVDEIGG